MTTLSRDGVALYYELSGTGTSTVVLVHCWGGDHTFMAAQARHLERSHRVLTVDLRGHGQSDKPEQAYPVRTFSDDIAWLCERLAITRAAVVGHSMGGSIALDLAARHPGLVRAVVMLEALVVAPPAITAGFRPVVDNLRANYPAVMRGFNDQLLGVTFDAGTKARLLDQYVAGNPAPQMIAALQGVLDFDSLEAAAACKAPALYVSSGPWYTDVERFRSLCPQLVTAQCVGSGHHLQLEVPTQVNAMIERFLQVQPAS